MTPHAKTDLPGAMPSAQHTLAHNPMQPPADSPATPGQACRAFLSHASVRILLAALLVLWPWRIWLGAWTWVDVALALGLWAAFPFIEWFIHVVMLHYRPRRIGRWTLDFRLPRTHRHHHAHPWDLDWVFVPLHIHAMVVPALLGAVMLAGPWRGAVLTFAAVFLTQGLHYEWVHFLGHIRWTPSWAYYQRRVREHRYHHFRNENYWWGVSRGLADRVLGTAPDARSTARSGTNKDLGIKP
jgi:hypothetical protein